MTAEVGTLEDFEAWLRTKNPKESYNSLDPHNCVLAQYLKDRVGRDRFSVCRFDSWRDQNGNWHPFKDDSRAFKFVGMAGEPTFGGALYRLQEKTRRPRWWHRLLPKSVRGLE